MNIIDAIKDRKLFRPFLGDDLSSWSSWLKALRVLYGLPVESEHGRQLIKECTGREAAEMPRTGFRTALFLIGRRGGKSRISALIAAYEAALAGHEAKLAEGETGIVAIVAPTKWQAKIVQKYVRAAFRSPLLRGEIADETRDGFKLKNGIEVVVLAGDWRTVRGPTLIAAIIDEAAFLGLDEETKVKSDTELVRAIKPGLATTNGRLIVISSPYAKKGWCYQTFKRYHGNNAGKTLVWNCASKVMNPVLDQAIIDEAMEDDLASALAEYHGQFRDDISGFITRDILDDLVVKERSSLPYNERNRYAAFCDVSGGRSDESALAIAHLKDACVVIDVLKRYKSPHDPHEVISDMIETLGAFELSRITGDNYAAEFVASTFRAAGIMYRKSEKPKSQLYRELLPRLTSSQVEMLDDETCLRQLAALERRTRSGGKDMIDHPPGGKDDVANALAGVVQELTALRAQLGAL